MFVILCVMINLFSFGMGYIGIVNIVYCFIVMMNLKYYICCFIVIYIKKCYKYFYYKVYRCVIIIV